MNGLWQEVGNDTGYRARKRMLGFVCEACRVLTS